MLKIKSMKYSILLILSSILIVTTWTSCSDDYLEVDSASSLYADEYYTTEDRIFEDLVAAYDPLQWFDWFSSTYNPLPFTSDCMADDVYVGGGSSSDCLYLHLMANYEAIATNIIDDYWTIAYSGVKRSNDVLEYMDDVTDISDENKALYLAEAKVLRAYYYTLLWKMWGNIPYYEENLTYPYTTEQYAADDVYTGIITTLEDAIANGGLPMKADADDYGRVTLAMAYMLYTEVVLYQNDDTRYDTALSYMEKIINSGDYALVDDFSGIWESDGEWSTESIWEINYFSTNGARAWDNTQGEGGSVYPTLIGIYSLSGSSDYNDGWGFEPVREEAYEMYDEADTRRDGGILNFTAYAEETGASYSGRYEDTGYFLKKYLPRADGNADAAGEASMNFNNNIRVYRYSETLLNAAELLVRGASGTGSASTYLNEVRERAGVDDLDATLDNIINERRLEFVGEGKRYWDLIRTGKASSVLVPNDYRTNTWSESKKYLPIPQSELASDANLVQNDY